MSQERVPVPRALVERLRELRLSTDAAQREAAGLLFSARLLLHIDGVIAGWDDGDEPALLVENDVENA